MLPRNNKVTVIIKSKEITLEAIFKPIRILNVIFGLYPYNIKFDKQNYIFNVVPNSLYLNLVVAAIQNIVFIFFSIWHVQVVVAINKARDFIAINYILQFFIMFLFCESAYVSVYTQRYELVHMLNLLASAWSEMPFGRNANMLKILQNKIRIIIVIVLIGIGIHLFMYFFRPMPWTIVMVSLVLIQIHFYQYAVVAHMFSIMLMVTTTLRNITEHLLIYSKPKSDISVVMLSSTALMQMASIYDKSYKVILTMNKSFQVSLLMLSLQCFHSLVTVTHISYHAIVITHEADFYQLLTNFIWTSLSFLKLYILAYVGGQIKSEVC